MSTGESFEMGAPDRVTVGTVGVPGQRTFYLQVEEGARTVALKMEKQQVGALGQLLAEMLSDLPTPEHPPSGPALDLHQPVVALWAVGAVQLSYDSDADRIVMLLEEADDPDGPGDQESAIGRLTIDRDQAGALVQISVGLLEAGRPPCPLCGNPIDPSGHACPRTNGHRPRTP